MVLLSFASLLLFEAAAAAPAAVGFVTNDANDNGGADFAVAFPCTAGADPPSPCP